jgi:hypothetical protein
VFAFASPETIKNKKGTQENELPRLDYRGEFKVINDTFMSFEINLQYK